MARLYGAPKPWSNLEVSCLDEPSESTFRMQVHPVVTLHWRSDRALPQSLQYHQNLISAKQAILSFNPSSVSGTVFSSVCLAFYFQIPSSSRGCESELNVELHSYCNGFDQHCTAHCTSSGRNQFDDEITRILPPNWYFLTEIFQQKPDELPDFTRSFNDIPIGSATYLTLVIPSQ